MSDGNYGGEPRRSPDPFVGRVPPRAEEAERYVLGSVLQDTHAADTAFTRVRLRPEDFFSERHQEIFRSVSALLDPSRGAMAPVDVISVAEELRSRGKLESAGGTPYLLELIEGVASTSSSEHHAGTVKEKALLRAVILQANEMIARAMDPSAEARETLLKSQSLLSDLAASQVSKGPRSAGEILDDTMTLIDRMSKKEIIGVNTGFIELDTLTTGLQGKQLIVLAARPGVGKTAFALSVMANAAIDHGRKVAFFSLEMDAAQLMLRVLCTRGQIEMQALRQGRLPGDMARRIPMIGGVLRKAPFYIDDQPDLTLLDLRTKCRQLKEREGLDMVILDYLQLMAGGDSSESRQVFISQVSRGLKAMAMELDVPVIALSQLSRKVEERQGGNKRPMLSDLRESGAIEQDADMVWFLSRDAYYGKAGPDGNPVDEAKADLIVAKHRNGPTADIVLEFKKQYAGFYNFSGRRDEGYN